MKTIYRILTHKMLLLSVLTILAALASCSDDDSGSGVPVIKSVRLTDPALVDSTFTNVFPGQMIAIIGEHLSGLQEVYINDQKVSFNINYSTAQSIVLTVPSDLLLTGSNPDLKGEIRVVTNHGEATYTMHVYSPAPTISRLVVNYPVIPGATMKVLGSNFMEIQRIYLTTVSPYSEGYETNPEKIEVEIPTYSVNTDFTELTIQIPATLIDQGYLVIQCYTDKAVSEFYRDLPIPITSGVSSDMPVIGAQMFITGKNFIGITSINVNDEYSILAKDLIIPESYDTIKFVLPKAPTKVGKLSVVGLGGVAEVPGTFYPVKNIILNYDGIGGYSWGNNTEKVLADGTMAPFASTGNCYAIKGKPGANASWWGNLVNSVAFPSTDVIPGNTSVANLELRFECYVSSPLESVVHDVVMCNDWDHGRWGYVLNNMKTGKTDIGRWMPCSIPISALTGVATYQDVLNIGNTELGLYTKNPSANADTYVEVYFDNFRLVKTN